MPVPPPPASVPVVSAVAGNAKVTLTWTAVPDAPGYSDLSEHHGRVRSVRQSARRTRRGSRTAVSRTTRPISIPWRRGTSVAKARARLPCRPCRSRRRSRRRISPPFPSTKQMTLTWSPSDGATAYNDLSQLDHQSTGERACCDRVAGSRFIDDTVVNGLTYFYRITARNDGGESSERSREVPARLVPAAPLMTAGALGGGRFFCAAPHRRPGSIQALLAVDAEA